MRDVLLPVHEGKRSTLAALPEIIDYFRKRGFEFHALSTDAQEREILARCPAKMGLPGLTGEEMP